MTRYLVEVVITRWEYQPANRVAANVVFSMVARQQAAGIIARAEGAQRTHIERFAPKRTNSSEK
jgi:hypothetical protein